MAGVNLSFNQVLEAAQRLPKGRRQELVEALTGPPAPEKVRAAARRSRGKYRMAPNHRKRMSNLLYKGNEGQLTADEGAELDQLVEDFQIKTLEMAKDYRTKR